MKLYFYANFNKLAGFYSQPLTIGLSPEEMAKDYVQIICNYDQETLKQLKELDLFCLGSFDNVTGEIKPENSFILHCGDVASKFIKEVKEDVGSKENA